MRIIPLCRFITTIDTVFFVGAPPKLSVSTRSSLMLTAIAPFGSEGGRGPELGATGAAIAGGAGVVCVAMTAGGAGVCGANAPLAGS